jgi:hypothetical protein
MPIFYSYFQTKFVGILLVLGLFAANKAWAQDKLIFINPTKGKLIEAKPGDFLIIKYKGYLGQTEFYKQTLLEIKDSSFVIGMYSFSEGSFFEKENPYKEINFKDVQAFRRRSIGGSISKSLLGLGAAVGSILVLDQLNENRNNSTLANLGISLGVGLSINFGLNLLFPDKPKYQIKEGWYIESIKN